MIPVLIRLGAESALAIALLYALAVAVVVYAAWSGWRGAALDAEGLKPAELRKKQQSRAITHGIIGALLARLGLYYALPPDVFLGGRGEGIPVHTYGVMMALGFLFAISLASQMAEREWLGEEGAHKREQILDLAFWVFLSGIGGSKLLFTIVNWNDYAGHLGEYLSSPAKIVDCLAGGVVFYGGLIGASIASFIYARRHHIDFLRLADLCIPTVSLGQCLGRLGCFSAGCCWGRISSASYKLGVHFPGASLARNLFGFPSNTSSSAFQSQSVDTRWVVESTGQVFHDAVPGAVRISEWVQRHGHTLPIHPTQLYESIGQFLLFCALMTLRRYRRFHGQIFAIWLMAYAVLRTTVELFRGDLERGTLHGLLESGGWSGLAASVPAEAWYNISTSQFISLCMFSVGAALLVRRWPRTDSGARPPQPASAAAHGG